MQFSILTLLTLASVAFAIPEPSREFNPHLSTREAEAIISPCAFSSDLSCSQRVRNSGIMYKREFEPLLALSKREAEIFIDLYARQLAKRGRGMGGGGKGRGAGGEGKAKKKNKDGKGDPGDNPLAMKGTAEQKFVGAMGWLGMAGIGIGSMKIA